MIYDLYGNPVSSGVFGETVPSNAFGFADPAGYRTGIICPCKPGDTVYSNTKLVDSGKALVLNYVPGTNTEDIPSSAILATMEPNDTDNFYVIDPGLTDAKSIFLQYGWGRTVGQGYDPHYEKNYRYFAQVGKSFTELPPHIAATQELSVFPDKNADKAFISELLKPYFPVIGKSAIICGDSLIEQSATGQTAYSGSGTLTGNLLDTTYGLGTMQEIARKYNMRFDVRGNGSCCWKLYTGGTANGDVRGGTADIDWIVSNGVQYDYCILAYGFNDMTVGSLGTADDTASNEVDTTTVSALRYCIETMQANFPETKLLVVMPMYCGDIEGYYGAVENYYNLIKPIVQSYHVRTVDMMHDSGIILGMANHDGMVNNDGVHLGPIPDFSPQKDTEACRRYARCLEAELLKL